MRCQIACGDPLGNIGLTVVAGPAPHGTPAIAFSRHKHIAAKHQALELFTGLLRALSTLSLRGFGRVTSPPAFRRLQSLELLRILFTKNFMPRADTALRIPLLFANLCNQVFLDLFCVTARVGR